MVTQQRRTDTRKNELQHSQECYIEENACATNEVKVPNASSENICDKNAISPFFVACSKGHESIVQILLDNESDVNLQAKDGLPPLFTAFYNGHEGTAQLLLENLMAQMSIYKLITGVLPFMLLVLKGMTAPRICY